MTVSSTELYIKILTIAADKGLPSYIDNTDIAPLHIFSELLNSGYLSGKREMRMGLPYFNNLAMTIPGRQFLQQLTEDKSKNTSSDAKINISHSTIAIGNENKIHSQSSQNSIIKTPPAMAAIKKILIGIFVTVVGGLILWYLTK